MKIQRHRVETGIGPSKNAEKVEDDGEEEVDVGDIVELKEKILWDETQSRIFCSPDFIPREFFFQVAFFVLGFRRDWNIHID